MFVATAVAALLGASVAHAALPDERGWEMVSPIEKNGGRVDPPGAVAGGGVLQAAAAGGAVTYDSATSFGPDPAGAPVASQYLATRVGEGWATQNLTAPTVSGSYDFIDEGVPYQAFSPDLARALLFNGKHCRGEATGCAVSNPPLPGTAAPSGYQNYYLREAGTFEALIRDSDVAGLGARPRNVRCPTRRRFTRPEDGRALELLSARRRRGRRLWSGQSQPLQVVSGRRPDVDQRHAGGQLGAQSEAVSSDGSRVYWTDANTGNLFLSEGGSNAQVDLAAGGGGVFQTASADGSVAFYTKGGHLWRYAGGTSTDLTPGGGVVGVLGASADGSVVYFQDGSALERWAGGATPVASGTEAADPSTYPPRRELRGSAPTVRSCSSCRRNS